MGTPDPCVGQREAWAWGEVRGGGGGHVKAVASEKSVHVMVRDF